MNPNTTTHTPLLPDSTFSGLGASSVSGEPGSAKWMMGVGSIICLVIAFQIILITSGLTLAFRTIKYVFVLLLKVEEEQVAEGMGGDWIVTGNSKGGGGGREAEELMRRRVAHLNKLKQINEIWSKNHDNVR
ncbi:hypothetical protein TrRE_jg429, partial [Triparma retinervis]